MLYYLEAIELTEQIIAIIVLGLITFGLPTVVNRFADSRRRRTQINDKRKLRATSSLGGLQHRSTVSSLEEPITFVMA